MRATGTMKQLTTLMAAALIATATMTPRSAFSAGPSRRDVSTSLPRTTVSEAPHREAAAKHAGPVVGNNLTKAQRIFERLLTITPNDPDIYKYLGDIHAARGEVAEAQRYYTQYAEMRPDDYYPYYRMGDLYWGRDERGKAKEEYGIALDKLDATKKPDLDARLAQARMNGLMGSVERSDEEFHTLLAEEPDNLSIVTTYIDTLADENRLDLALDEAERFSAMHPDNIALKRAQARILMLKHDYNGAERILAELMERYPNDSGIKTDYAYALYSQRDWYGAWPVFEELAALHPEHSGLLASRDDAFRGARPYLRWGLGFISNSFEKHIGPYARYVHPINSTMQFEAGYQLERLTSSIPNFDPNYVVYTNTVDLIFRYKPHWTTSVGGGIANQLSGSTYAPAPLLTADYNHPVYGQAAFYFVYNELFDDPVSALYFGGRQARVALTYANRFYDRVIATAGYNSNWYWIDAAKTGTNLGNEFAREDVAQVGIQFIILKRPEIRLGYEFFYSKLHVVNDYLPIIPLITESQRHNIIYGFDHDWNRWFFTSFGGFVGADPKRNLSLADLDLYGFNAAVGIRVSRQFEIMGTYQYSSEDLVANTGRYHAAGLDFIYRF